MRPATRLDLLLALGDTVLFIFQRMCETQNSVAVEPKADSLSLTGYYTADRLLRFTLGRIQPWVDPDRKGITSGTDNAQAFPFFFSLPLNRIPLPSNPERIAPEARPSINLDLTRFVRGSYTYVVFAG